MKLNNISFKNWKYLCIALAMIYIHQAKALPTTSGPSTLLDLDRSEIMQASNEELALLLGKKLSISDKILVKRIKKQLSKNPEMTVAAAAEKTAKQLAIAGMVVGILSLFTFFLPYVGVIIPIAGITLSSFALSNIKKMKNTKKKGKGMAIAGLICSIIGLTTGLTILLVYFVFSFI